MFTIIIPQTHVFGHALVFVPGLVSLSQLPDGGAAQGRWSVNIAGASITGGHYRLARVENRVEVELDVTEHWKSQNLPLGMNILTRLMRVFRTWPASYRWLGTVDLGDAPRLLGAWHRKQRL
jgi:hypothetical protein